MAAGAIGAMGGHMILHFGMVRRGLELPPHHSAHVHVPNTALYETSKPRDKADAPRSTTLDGR